MATQPTSTVNQVFQSNKLKQWWLYPTQRYGTNQEMGTDYSVGGTGLPVGSISAGKVVYVGAPYANDPIHSSLGYVVQVQSTTGQLIHYQHLKSPSVKIGQTIGTGSVIGLSGGCANGHYGAVGSPCTPNNAVLPCGNIGQDCWSSGAHIEVRMASAYNPAGGVWNQNWSDPYAAFLNLANKTAVGAGPAGAAAAGVAAAAGTAGAAAANPLAGLVGGISGLASFPTSASFQLPAVNVGPTASVTQLLQAMDIALELVNPFDVLNAPVDTVGIPGVAGVSFTDPIGWLEGFGFNLMADLTAILLRLFLILLGVFIVYKVVSHWIDINKAVSGVTDLGMQIAKVAALTAV